MEKTRKLQVDRTRYSTWKARDCGKMCCTASNSPRVRMKTPGTKGRTKGRRRGGDVKKMSTTVTCHPTPCQTIVNPIVTTALHTPKKRKAQTSGLSRLDLQLAYSNLVHLQQSLVPVPDDLGSQEFLSAPSSFSLMAPCLFAVWPIARIFSGHSSLWEALYYFRSTGQVDSISLIHVHSDLHQLSQLASRSPRTNRKSITQLNWASTQLNSESDLTCDPSQLPSRAATTTRE
jgi:hypothetical protein